MMWGYGQGMGWMWLWGPLMLMGIAGLVLLGTRMVNGGVGRRYVPGSPQEPGGPPLGRSRARQILDERFAKGDLTEEQYREHLKVLGEGP